MPDFAPFRDQLRNPNRGNRATATGTCSSSIITSTDLCLALLREVGVAVLPGTAFGFDADTLAVRMCFVDFDGGALLDEVRAQTRALGVNKDDCKVVDEIVDRHASHVYEGIEALAEWIRGLRVA